MRQALQESHLAALRGALSPWLERFGIDLVTRRIITFVSFVWIPGTCRLLFGICLCLCNFVVNMAVGSPEGWSKRCGILGTYGLLMIPMDVCHEVVCYMFKVLSKGLLIR